ncbi:MAG: hypothetical protein AAF555_09505 [Verrucomicrobiota bacterium]
MKRERIFHHPSDCFLTTGGSGLSPRGRAQKSRQNGLLWWVVGTTLLLAGATGSWLACLYIFGYPEKPQNYQILQSFERLSPPQVFSRMSYPEGQGRASRHLYGKFRGYNQTQLEALNARLKRDYIRNYEDAHSLSYLEGSFRIESARVLGEADFFQKGLLVEARSKDYPFLAAEILLPTKKALSEFSQKDLQGETLTLSAGTDFAALLHVAREDEKTIRLSVVPLSYRQQQFKKGPRLALSPPRAVNPRSDWPLGEALAPYNPAGNLAHEIAARIR